MHGMTPDPAMNPQPGSAYTLARYIADVTAAMDRQLPLEDTVKLIVDAKRRFVTGGAGLPAHLMKVHPTANYTRNLVHHDPAGRFTTIAILWGPFQETAVHDHFNWCVVGVVSGNGHVVNYERLDDESRPGQAQLAVRDSMVVRPGTVTALLPPPRSNIHKMANATGGLTVTLHTYGDPGTRATAFDLRAGTYQSLDLKFHNQEP